MSEERVIEDEGGPGNRWWLPALLVVLILAILAGAYWATHPHLFGSSPTPTAHVVTSTAQPITATPKAGPTGTPKAGPTGTARPGPTSQPRPGPTGTPKPGPTGTPKPGPTGTPNPSG